MFLIKTKSEKKLFESQRCLGIKNMLDNDYPLVLVICFIIGGILLGIGAISFQIVSIVYEAPLYYIGTGIWVGVLMVINEIFLIVLSIQLNFSKLL